MIAPNDPCLPLSVDQQLLDAVVNLTSQRDPETLAESLVDTITKLTNAHIVSVYALEDELANMSASVIASTNPYEPKGTHLSSLESHSVLRECIESQQIISTNLNNGQRKVYPIFEQGNVSGLLLCEYVQNDLIQSNEVIQAITSVYGNHQSLLNYHQRDGLTGLYNRAALQNWLDKALNPDRFAERRADSDGSIGCFALLDIDFFKRINDTQGHLYGDEVLQVFADLMRESFRFNDQLFRYGGEEFVAVLSETDLDAALTVLERFRTTVSQHNFSQLNQVTVTIGVSEILPRLQSGKLIERADKALYYGKNNSRNQVNAYEWLDQGDLLTSLEDSSQSFKLF
jgi:diguanylate cyclase (GGDEF)-like protein